MNKKQQYVEEIREFNRFYTMLIGILDRNYLETGYSVTENRIMFEIYHNTEISASYLSEKLRLNKGYISRVINGFEKKGIIERSQSDVDGRKLVMKLTANGEKEAERLFEITNRKILDLIEPLSTDTCNSLCEAMKYITETLNREAKEQQQ